MVVFQHLQVDKVGDSAYLPCSHGKPIHISKELVVLGLNGFELVEADDPGVISFRFGVRDFVEGVDEDVPTLILDKAEDSEICGIEIPHYSYFSQWLVAQETTPGL